MRIPTLNGQLVTFLDISNPGKNREKMIQNKIERCATLLFQARKFGFRLHEMPPNIRPDTINEAYDVQNRLKQMMLNVNAGRNLIGYKAANTNPSSQQFLQLNEPFFGPLISSEYVGLVGTSRHPAIIKSGMKYLNVRLCEPEFAFLIGEERKLVGVAPALEIVHSSYLDWKTVGAPSLIADLACNGGWIRGEAVPLSSNIELKGCKLLVNENAFGFGHANKVMGTPLNVIETFLKQPQSLNLKEGDWITTGVCVDPASYHYLSKGDRVEVQFEGGIGSVAIICKD
jgi:2-keto-4-pentenoate hydratase